MSNRKGLDYANLGNIRYVDELELVSVLRKDLLEVSSLRLRPDGSSDRVTPLEEDVDNVDSSEAVRSCDEDFTARGDDWHILLIPEALDEV